MKIPRFGQSKQRDPTSVQVDYTFVAATSGTTRPRSSSAKIANQIDLIVFQV